MNGFGYQAFYIQSHQPDDSAYLYEETPGPDPGSQGGKETVQTEQICIKTDADANLDPLTTDYKLIQIHSPGEKTQAPHSGNGEQLDESEPALDDQIDPKPSPYERAGFINKIHYLYAVISLCQLRKKNKGGTLRLEDLPLLGQSEEVSYKTIQFEKEYERYKKKHGKPSLFWPIMRVFWRRIFKEEFLTLVYNACKLAFAYFLSQVLELYEAGNKGDAYRYAGGLFGSVILGCYAYHFGFFQGVKMNGHLRPVLIGMIYKKINRLSYFSINQVSIGKIVNIAANDLNYFEFNIYFIYYLIAAPLTLGGALGLLWYYFGVACLPGVGCVLLMWPLQYLFSAIGGKYLKQKNPTTDERIKLTNEMIEGIRLLKMYGWDTQFAEMIEKVRNKEVSLLRKIGYTEYFAGHMLARLTPVLGSFLIFMTYGLMGNTPTVGKVYATIMILFFLRVSAVLFSSMAFKFVVEARLIFQRIIQLLEVDELNAYKVNPPKDPSNGIEFNQFSAFWGENKKQPGQTQEKNSQKNNKAAQIVIEELTFENPTLKNISFSVKKGTLCALVGKIGCGKSTALMSFFNEVPKTTGELRFSGRLAYVEQEVVIYPGTVRSNILFGKPYDEEKYRKITEACCLLDDFKAFANGDLTEIGERGVNMSGGQKARTSLARALYSDADIYLLDDPLSAVDTKVAKNLFNHAIRGVLKDKTVLLATHQVHFAREAEKIIVLDNGEVKAEGTLEQIVQQDATILSIFETKQRKKTADSIGENPVHTEKDSVQTKTIEALVKKLEPEEEEEVDKARSPLNKEEKGALIQKEKDESSQVGLKTYWFYFKNGGNIFSLLLFFINLAAIEVLYVMYTRLLGYWTQGTWSPETSMKALAGIIGGFIFCLILRQILFVNFSIRISQSFHRKILRRVMRAVVEFYDTNPSGRILNRFSNDMGVLDRFILSVSNDVIDAAVFFFAIFITIWIVVPWLLIPGFALFVFYYGLVRFVKRAIVQGRGVELLTRSPIYSVFSTTLAGLITIRIYGQGKRFVREFTHLLNRNARAFHSYYDSNRVFGFYSDYSSAIFACAGVAILLATNIDPGLLGLTCSYVMSVTDYAQWAMRQMLMHLMQMASTERIKTYTQIQQEAELSLPSDKELVENHWPAKGEVVFNNVHMKYRKNTDHVLKGLTFSVKGGEKIGCVGRTGAGKSSILQALFRMVEIDKESVPDSYIKIDGVDTQATGLHLLRKNISIIPQTPYIFMGSVRRNLDPLNEYSEQRIIDALIETGLWDYIKTLPKGLETDMSNASSVFSVGQKQLICLARTLLQNNKILVLDEATANIDFETDNFIQQKIMERFKDSTIFTIAHRLSTVANYDKVLVMDKGRVIEFDHPYKLLVKNIGDTSITNSDGVFGSMVANTGSKHSQVIFEIARKSYYKTHGLQLQKSEL